MKTKAVVTGGAGFIGSNLVAALLKKDFDVHVVDTFAAGKRDDRLHANATYHEVDIRDAAKLAPIMQGATYVFHLAALPRVQYSIENPIETFDVNATGTIVVLKCAHEAGVKRAVFSSSAAIYGDQEVDPLSESLPALPKSPYGLHKEIGEKACRLWSESYGLSTVALRYFNVYGPGFDAEGPYGLVVGKFLTEQKKGNPLPIAGDGTHTRDYVHVSDVVAANIAAAEAADAGHAEIINVGTGRETSVNEIATLIGGATTSVEARHEPARARADISQAKKILGWEPVVKLEDGLTDLKKMLSL